MFVRACSVVSDSLRLHGQRSLVGYSPWGRKELDMTATITHSLIAMSFVFLNLPILKSGMGREVGGGFRMGNMCIPVVDSC